MARRQYIIDKKFQWTIIGYTFAISILTTVGHMILSRLAAFAEMQIQSGFGTNWSAARLAAIGVTLFFYGAIFIIALLFSNRLAGPLFRLRRHMDEASRKRPAPPVRFRKDDYFHDLQESYNRLLESLPADRKQGGFSLLEMMVTLGVAMIVALMATSSFTGITQATLLFNQDVNRLQGILMTARNSALSKNECAQVTASPTSVKVRTFPIGAPCAPLPAADFQTIQTFNNGTAVGDFSTGATLMFKPGGGLLTTTPVTIQLTAGTLKNRFTIYPAIGQVRHQ
jgi:type II secretory pathway pseudopilin PulG